MSVIGRRECSAAWTVNETDDMQLGRGITIGGAAGAVAPGTVGLGGQ